MMFPKSSELDKRTNRSYRYNLCVIRDKQIVNQTFTRQMNLPTGIENFVIPLSIHKIHLPILFF